jgi:hypothetical protein
MAKPDNINSETIRLLNEADWLWSDSKKAFVKARDPEQETTENYRSRSSAQISYEELRDHGLAGTASEPERYAGLQWLRDKLSA